MNVTNCMHAYILQQEDDCNRKIQTSELAHPDQRFQYRLGGRVIVGDNPRVVNTDLCVCVCVCVLAFIKLRGQVRARTWCMLRGCGKF